MTLIYGWLFLWSKNFIISEGNEESKDTLCDNMEPLFRGRKKPDDEE